MSESDKQSKVVSLADRRRNRNQELLRQAQTPEQRIQELETDCLRLIDHALDIEKRMLAQEKHLRQLITALHSE